MDNNLMQEATREKVKKKFKNKQYVESKVAMHYPQSAEREYVRLVNSYMKLLNNVVSKNIPRIRNTLSDNRHKFDAADNEELTKQSVDKIFDDIMDEFMTKQGLFGLSVKLERLSKLNRKLTIEEWKRVVKRTLGINIMEDYYNGEKYQRIFDNWLNDNISLIKTIPEDTLGSMRNIVREGYLTGASNKIIAKKIQEAYDVDKNRAMFYARDQTSKLNAQVTQEQQKDAGVEWYVWRTAGNVSTFPNSARVRESHAHLNNKRFKYSEPPIVDAKTGRRANPGEDYRCRCIALPVFDIDTVVLAWEKDGD